MRHTIKSIEYNLLSETTWANIVQNDKLRWINKEKWCLIYKICFNSIPDNNVIWFQCQVLNKILGTQDYPKKLKIIINNTCTFCGTDEENINHLFNKHREVTQLWKNIQQWMKNKIGVNITSTRTMKILGYLVRDENFWPLNVVLIPTRKYFGVQK